MHIVIVGGGASGLLAALAIKRKHYDYDVTLIDRNNKLGKKLRATGNGKANIANLGSIKNQYSNETRAKILFDDITCDKLLSFFNQNDIATINYGNYVYPYSESAQMLTDTLIKNGLKLGVKYLKETKAIDYHNHILKTDKGDIHFDKLIIASGLMSMPKLGADASFILNLKTHGYHIIDVVASLTPIRTVETTKAVAGLRRKVNVKLVANNKTYMDEDGELLFKKDGLSGIVIFHASSIYLRRHLKDAKIIVDFLPHIKLNYPIDNYFQDTLASYLKRFKNVKEAEFHIKDLYGENDSVASIGGVSLDDVDYNFASKIEDDVYIIGEALNQDGLCGGFNLMWAFSSALKVSAII